MFCTLFRRIIKFYVMMNTIFIIELYIWAIIA